jgi:hypothetical protein
MGLHRSIQPISCRMQRIQLGQARVEFPIRLMVNHLPSSSSRPRFYPPAREAEPTPLSDQELMRNRPTVLLPQDALLTAAVAMARTPAFYEATQWLQEQPDTRFDRPKLGGIHRAQPFSHHFERGNYQHYFIVKLADLHRADQIAAYELLRDGRVQRNDVRPSSGNSDVDSEFVDDPWELYYLGDGWGDAATTDVGIGDTSNVDAGLDGVDYCPNGWDGDFNTSGTL